MNTLLLHPGTVPELLADLLTTRPRAALVNERGRVIGQDHHRARLTDHDVWLIHELRREGLSCPQIALKFSISVHTVRSISSGRRRGQVAVGQLQRRST